MPRLWSGATVVVAAPGPSLTAEDLALVRAAGPPVVAVGDAWRLAPFAAVLYHSDAPWWSYHAGVPGFDGLKMTQLNTRAPPDKARDERAAAERFGLRAVPSGPEPGLSADPAYLRHGGNSGHAALNIAYLAGAARALLLGFDGRRGPKGAHYFGDHPPAIKRVQPYGNWRTAFAAARASADALGFAVVNCTPGSAIDAFPRRRLAEALAVFGPGA